MQNFTGTVILTVCMLNGKYKKGPYERPLIFILYRVFLMIVAKIGVLKKVKLFAQCINNA